MGLVENSGEAKGKKDDDRARDGESYQRLRQPRFLGSPDRDDLPRLRYFHHVWGREGCQDNGVGRINKICEARLGEVEPAADSLQGVVAEVERNEVVVLPAAENDLINVVEPQRSQRAAVDPPFRVGLENRGNEHFDEQRTADDGDFVLGHFAYLL
jgi:hypothetical protein